MTKEEALSNLFNRTKKAIDKARKIENPAERNATLFCLKAKAFAEHIIISNYYIIMDIKEKELSALKKEMHQVEQDLLFDMRTRSY